MIDSLVTVLVAALVLLVLFIVIGNFIKGAPLQIIGLIFGLILLLYALKVFRVALPVLLAGLLLTGCAAQAPPPAKTVYLEWHGIRLAYQVPADNHNAK